MKIIVCIKQVPDTTDIKWTENNTIRREGVESITNPCDVYAVEEAVKLDGDVTALTMGPSQAEIMLRGAIAAGCSHGVLVSDRKFAGADTFATSRTLAAAIRKLGGIRHPEPGSGSQIGSETGSERHVDLIVCGQYAVDGDTAQTGPEIANTLELPQVTYVREIVSVEHGYITVKRELDEGIETVRAKLPALICVLKGNHEPKRPHINDIIRAQKAEITVYNADDLGLTPEQTGLKGSPTYVSRAFRMVTKHEPQMAGSIERFTEMLRNVILRATPEESRPRHDEAQNG